MRICFIALGEFTHVDAYIEYAWEQRHDVHFVALAPGRRRRVPTYSVGWRALGKWAYIPAMLRARRVVRVLAPDIVHAHYATSAGLAAYVCGVHPYIVTAHGTDLAQGTKSPVWRAILRRVLRSADCVNTVSEELTGLVLALGVPAERVETLTLGVDTRRFQGHGGAVSRAPGALRLICTRHFEAVYDHETLVRGLGVLARRGVDFEVTLVGDGSLRPRTEALAVEHGLKERAQFVGRVPNDRLPELLAEHDVYLSASTRDGTSLSLLEAMASGLYPVVSDITANRAWIREGVNGRLHGVGDAESLADCLTTLEWGTEKISSVMRSNRELVVAKGDRLTNMRRLEHIYRRCAAARQGPTGRTAPGQ